MINELYADSKSRMQSALDHVKHELGMLRTGRANPKMVDSVKVDYYGSLQPLKTLANVSAPEPRLLVIDPFDKSQITVIEKAIQQANLGLTASNDGNVLRLGVPELTEERRQEYAKMAHRITEEGRIVVRNIRRDANNELKDHSKNHEISEDNLHRAIDNFQELTNDFIKRLDEILATKEKEILNN